MVEFVHAVSRRKMSRQTHHRCNSGKSSNNLREDAVAIGSSAAWSESLGIIIIEIDEVFCISGVWSFSAGKSDGPLVIGKLVLERNGWIVDRAVVKTSLNDEGLPIWVLGIAIEDRVVEDTSLSKVNEVGDRFGGILRKEFEGDDAVFGIQNRLGIL